MGKSWGTPSSLSSSESFISGLVAGILLTATTCYVVATALSDKKQATTTNNNKNDDDGNEPSEHLPPPRRYGGAIRMKREMYNQYTQLHDAVWDEVLQRMSKSNMRNFTIYYHEETSTMFSHFEWIGHWKIVAEGKKNHDINESDIQKKFQQDMDAISNDPIVQKWWSFCEPCQVPFTQYTDKLPPSKGGQGDWWAPLDCLNHCGHWSTSYADKLRDPNWIAKNPYGFTSTSTNPPSSS